MTQQPFTMMAAVNMFHAWVARLKLLATTIPRRFTTMDHATTLRALVARMKRLTTTMKALLPITVRACSQVVLSRMRVTTMHPQIHLTDHASTLHVPVVWTKRLVLMTQQRPFQTRVSVITQRNSTAVMVNA